MPSADDIIAILKLAPHPEGGHYRETFRHTAESGRDVSTAIYYLLKQGELSRWHRIDTAEIWHWYAGAPLELTQAGEGASKRSAILGNDLTTNQHPQIVVPPNVWQSARSIGAWTLVGCTVAPGFTFDCLEFAPSGWSPPN